MYNLYIILYVCMYVYKPHVRQNFVVDINCVCLCASNLNDITICLFVFLNIYFIYICIWVYNILYYMMNRRY